MRSPDCPIEEGRVAGLIIQPFADLRWRIQPWQLSSLRRICSDVLAHARSLMPRACPECKKRPHFTSSSDLAIETQEGRRRGARHSLQRLGCKQAMRRCGQRCRQTRGASWRLQWPRRPNTALRSTQCQLSAKNQVKRQRVSRARRCLRSDSSEATIRLLKMMHKLARR